MDDTLDPAPLHLLPAQAEQMLKLIELDLRDYLGRSVCPVLHDRERIFGDKLETVIRVAKSKRRPIDVSDPNELLEALFMQDTWELLNRHAALLHDGGKEIKRLTPILNGLVGLRNEYAHPSRFAGDEYDLEACKEIAAAALLLTASAIPVDRVRGALRQLEQDPDWGRLWIVPDAEATRIPNNVPSSVDFDDWGFIGREGELKELMDRLSKRNDRAITIVGEGGIGKTALAQRALRQLLEDPREFTAIVWTSLKRDRFSYRGKQTETGWLRSLDDILETVADVLSLRGPGDPVSRDVLDVIKGEPILVVIDNAESAEGAEVLALIDEFPRDTTFLLTSRVGLGQVERRIDVDPLSGSHAVAMLRRVADARRVTRIAQARQEILEDYADRLRRRPLALFWFVEGIDAGSEPEELLAGQDDLIRYCVGSVYDGLDAASRTIAFALSRAAKPMEVGPLAQVAGLAEDDARTGLHHLAQRNLVSHELDARGTGQTYELTELAFDYVTEHPHADVDRDGVDQRYDQLRTLEEAREKARQGDVLTLDFFDATTQAEQAAAAALGRAIRAARRRDAAHLDQADALVSGARDFAPRYWKVAQVGAYMAHLQGRDTEATELYREARGLALTDDSRGAAAYSLAEHLHRRGEDPSAAFDAAQEAHDALRRTETAALLARITASAGGRPADALIVLAEQIQAQGWDSEGPAHITDADVNLMRQWSWTARKVVERLRDEGNALDAVRSGAQSIRTATQLPGAAADDLRVHEAMVKLLAVTCAAVRETKRGSQQLDDMVIDILEAVEGWRKTADRLGLGPAIERVLSEELLDKTTCLSGLATESVGRLITGAVD